MMNNPYREAALSAKCQTAAGAIVQETDSNFSFNTTTMLPAQSGKMCRLRALSTIKHLWREKPAAVLAQTASMLDGQLRGMFSCFPMDTYGKQNIIELIFQ